MRRNTQVRKKAEPSTDGCSIGKKEMRRVVPGCVAPRPPLGGGLFGSFWGRHLWPLQKTLWDSTKLSKKRTTHINHLPSGNFTDCYGHWPIYIPHYPSTQWIRKVWTYQMVYAFGIFGWYLWLIILSRPWHVAAVASCSMAMRKKVLTAALKGSESKVVGTPTNKQTMAISGYINGLI